MNLLFVASILAAATTTAFASRVVCYYTNWSVYRKEAFKIEYIDPSLCTHVVYSFIGLDEAGFVKSVDEWNDFGDAWTEGGFKKFMRLRNLNPSVKLLVSVGGWNEGSVRFQGMVRNPDKRRIFLQSSLGIIEQFKLDGLEIDWVYQDSWGGTPQDKEGYSQLVREMKPVYEKKGLILCLSTSANAMVMDNSYDIPVLSKYSDFISVMSYDLHGSWDKKTGHVAPLRPMKSENELEKLINVETVIKRYIQKGADPAKLNVGIVGYGRTFTLLYPNMNGMNSPIKGPGTIEPLPYFTFCLQDRNGMWTKLRNDEQAVPYAVAGDQWVGYEDATSLKEKVKFAKSVKLGGVTFWSLDMDDFKGNCGGRYPLLRVLKEELAKP